LVLNKTERFSKVSGYALCSDRSSDFPALLAAFPFINRLINIRTVAHNG